MAANTNPMISVEYPCKRNGRPHLVVALQASDDENEACDVIAVDPESGQLVSGKGSTFEFQLAARGDGTLSIVPVTGTVSP